MQTDKQRRRLSLGKLLGKRDKEPQHHPSNSTQPSGGDSAYASSENEPKASTSTPDVVPIKNDGAIPGIGEDRNLNYNQKTGDVTDEETGEVVSTVTTTTTTTT
jgi:hypothetical protein